MRDRLAVTVADLLFLLQALSGERQRVPRLAAPQQQVGQRVANLGHPRGVPRLAVHLMGAEEVPLGTIEVAAIGVEQPPVVKPLAAFRAGDRGVLGDRALVEQPSRGVGVATVQRQQGEQVDGGGGGAGGSLSLGLGAGSSQDGLGLGLTARAAGDQQSAEVEASVGRQGRLARINGPAEQVAGLVEPAESLGLERPIHQLDRHHRHRPNLLVVDSEAEP